MSDKSQHRRSKQPTRNKKRKNRQGFSATVTRQPAASQNYVPVSPALTPSAKVKTPTSPLSPVQHPYITAELRRIAILAGIMLAILVILSLIIA